MTAPDNPAREPHKFDPSRAGKLESPERQETLPNGRVVELLDLQGSETVVDYGAGSGVLTLPVAESLPGGVVYAVDESPEMIQHLENRLAETNPGNVYPRLIENNRVELADRCVDRVLAVNLLHEVVNEGALAEMRRAARAGRRAARRRLARRRRTGDGTPRGSLPDAGRGREDAPGSEVRRCPRRRPGVSLPLRPDGTHTRRSLIARAA